MCFDEKKPMTVKQLIETLKKCPEAATVRVSEHGEIDHVKMVKNMETDETIVFIK